MIQTASESWPAWLTRSNAALTALQALPMPIVVAIVLGGGVTLLYGLALFAPLVDLLQGLARP
jgi:hypothetical protein